MMRNYSEAQRRVEELSQQSHQTNGPSLISRREPEYTEAARKARIQGKVELSVTVGTNGMPRDIQVTHPLDPGLDEKAIESVKTWRFRPAMRNGEPVTSFIVVEVPFRLL
jgi:TonB family protein